MARSSDPLERELARLEVFAAWRMMEAPGRREYRRFFDSHTDDSAKVSRTITECLEKPDLPSLAALRDIWLAMFPPAGIRGCALCGGTGWREVYGTGWDRKVKYNGVRRCECRGARGNTPQ